MKKTIITLVIVVISLSIVVVSLYWPFTGDRHLRGTLGGVEKAERYRGEQPQRADILYENDDFTKLTQSAEWQNALKDEEFVAFLQSDDFRKSILLMKDMQNLLLMRSCFDIAKNAVAFNQDYQTDTFGTGWTNNSDFNNAVFSFAKDFQKVLLSQDNPKSMTFGDALNVIVPLSSDFNSAMTFFSNDMQQFIASQEFDEFLASKEFAKLNMYTSGWSQEFTSWVNNNPFDQMDESNAQDYQNSMNQFGQDFQNLVMSSEFQSIVTQDFSGLIFTPLSQDFQNAFTLNMINDLNAVFLANSLNASEQLSSVFNAFDDYLESIMLGN